MDFVRNILRLAQFLWVLLVTALVGHVINSNINGHQAAVNFAMFAAVLAWLSMFYGLASGFVGFLAEGLFAMIGLVLDAAATLFTLLAGIVLAAKLGGKSCSGDLGAKHNDSWIGFGSNNDGRRCRELQASTAFMWFLTLCLGASLVLSFLNRRRYGGSSSVGSSVPHMSQVNV